MMYKRTYKSQVTDSLCKWIREPPKGRPIRFYQKPRPFRRIKDWRIINLKTRQAGLAMNSKVKYSVETQWLTSPKQTRLTGTSEGQYDFFYPLSLDWTTDVNVSSLHYKLVESVIELLAAICPENSSSQALSTAPAFRQGPILKDWGKGPVLDPV